MVSKYDILYIIATKGAISVSEIVEALDKPKDEYNNVFNNVLELEKEGHIKRDKEVKFIHNKNTLQLCNLIDYCIKNGINYNLLFKKNMLDFLEKASKNEFFTRKEIPIHSQTFQQYTEALEEYDLMLIVSRKPLKCKLLKHHLIKEILNYFEKDSKFYDTKQISFINQIKKEYNKYKRKAKIHKIRLDKLEKNDEIKFIHTSLHLEGNPITLVDTQKIILNDIMPTQYKLEDVNEVQNYKKAVSSMITNTEKHIPLTLSLILRYHHFAMYHIPEAGELRKQNVRIKGNLNFKTADYKLVLKKLNDLMQEYEIFKTKKEDIKDIIHFAAYFHNEFQRIHPFIDGNSRTSRLLLFHILRENDLPVMDLPLGYFDEYLDLTKRSEKRDDERFKYLVEEIVYFNLKRINRGM